jgi:hypothetical protein
MWPGLNLLTTLLATPVGYVGARILPTLWGCPVVLLLEVPVLCLMVSACCCCCCCCCCCLLLLLQEGDKQETDRNYENMWRALRSDVGIGQSVPLIRLVCNHTSFAQTVENIFTLSFLVSLGGCLQMQTLRTMQEHMQRMTM